MLTRIEFRDRVFCVGDTVKCIRGHTDLRNGETGRIKSILNIGGTWRDLKYSILVDGYYNEQSFRYEGGFSPTRLIVIKEGSKDLFLDNW